MTPHQATAECSACHARENAVLALASSALPEGWFFHTITNPATGATADLVVCPRCRPLLADVLARRPA